MKVYRVYAKPDAAFKNERPLGIYEAGTLGAAMKQAHEKWHVPMEGLRAEEMPHVCPACGQAIAEKNGK